MKQLVIDNYVVTTPLIDIINHIRDNLTNGKLKDVTKKGTHISVTCPHHKDGKENDPSCGVYIGDDESNYGHFNCFTCGEHGDFIHFVALCFDSTESFAKKWLINNYGELKYEINIDLEPIDLSSKKKEQALDESVLDVLQSWHPYMDKRHLTQKVCEVFKVKYDPKSESIVFPVWDDKGKLYMLTRRSVKSKQFFIPPNTEKPIYLMNYIKEKGIQEVTVVESQINALTAWGWGIPTVATFGCNITDKQMEIFNKSDLRHIYLCFDGDEAGRKGTAKFIKGIRKDIFVDVIIMPSGKDVNDLTEEEFNKLKIISSHEWQERYSKKQ